MNDEITNTRTYSDLEFNKLKSIIKKFATSSLGKDYIDKLEPRSDKESIERDLETVKECRNLFEKPEPFRLKKVEDLTSLITEAQEHPPLTSEEFLTINESLANSAEAKDYIAELPQDEAPNLENIARRIDGSQQLRSEIRTKIDRRGEIRDTATSTLFDLLKRKRNVESQVKENLNQFMSSHGSLIQDNLVVQRSNRLVVPLRSSAKERVDCVIHGSSNSGRTLFAEPSSAVKLNNELKDLISEIHEEKKKIRQELTNLFLNHKSKILRTQRTVKLLDSVYARAEYAQQYSCSNPKVTKDDGLHLIDARHPLLDPSEVVPISIKIGDSKQGATITGPNTGGKTVTLKTIGLFSLMIQSGIPIPASIDSQVEIYDEIYSDIGDEQSIEQSLSTFSSHIGNIINILQHIGPNSLTLLDELGAGTDPEEGAALGLSLLESLLDRGCRFAVTTHYTAIKNYSFSHPQLSTFSVDFDPVKLKPTYHILEGVPGKSNAFVIASRLGLSDSIIKRAESFLHDGKIQTENIIQDLVEEKREVRDKKQQLEKQVNSARKANKEYKEKLQQIKQDKNQALNAKIRELDNLVSRAKEKVEQTIADARKYDKQEAQKSIKEVRELERELEKGKVNLEEAHQSTSFSLSDLDQGEKVWVLSADENGVIERINTENDIKVQTRGLTISTDLMDLRPARSDDHKPSKSTSVDYEKFSGPAGIELNVRGMTVQDALREVDTYVDRLIRADRKKGRILHGKGTGTLRRNIRQHLRESGLVNSCYGPPPSEGGEGVTIFEL